jgi:hypothetical protein
VDSSNGSIRPYLLLVVGLAAALHIYQFEFVFREVPPLGVLAFSIWSLIPYIACVLVAWVSISPAPASVAATVALFFDIGMHFTVTTSKSSTAGLGFIFMPLRNLVLIVPITMFVVWVVVKERRLDRRAP